MAETLSVTAVLSAVDRGFNAAMNSARTSVGKLGTAVKSGIGFGVMAAAGMTAFNAVSSGVRGLVTEINDSNAAWKTFEKNMQIIGKSSSEINSAKKAMQSYAEKTIYSSSDMATTYAQLEAVGVKSADKLVTAFGGLAAAAENPQQAMKTLSQQATQMAAKPKVAWQDFKLMLEQTPAGIASVAKEMGMTTDELVAAVQSGTVATEDFFAAIEAVGNSDGFYDLATQAKTVGQAMDGLKETLGNKLGPAFEVLSMFAIGEISKVSDALGGIDAEGLATKVSSALQAAQPYWEAFKSVLVTVGGALKTVGSFFLEHADIISKVIPVVLALVAAYNAFKVVNAVLPMVSGFTQKITSLANTKLNKMSKDLYGVAKGEEKVGKASKTSGKNMIVAAGAFLLMGVGVLAVATGFYILAKASIALAESGGYAVGIMFMMVGALAAIGIGMAILLKSIASVGAQALPAAAAMMFLGVAVILVAAGFALFAQTAIQLAEAGGLAIGVMAGLVIALGGLMILAAALAPALSVGALGFIAFGAAIALVGVGALLAAAALYVVAGVLPIVVQYGAQGAIAIAQLGAGMMVFAAGALLAGVACVVLGAGLVVVAAGMILAGASIVVVAAGMVALSAAVLLLSAGVMTLGAGLTICATAFMMMAAALPPVAASSILLVASFTLLTALSVALGAGLMVTTAAIIAIGAAAVAGAAGITVFGAAILASAAGVLALSAALSAVNSRMKSIANSAKTVQKSLTAMVKSVKVVESGLSALGSKAKSAMNTLINAFSNAANKATSAGQQLGTGFYSGMNAGLVLATAAAKKAVTTINSAFRSGYSNAYSSGAYISKGFANGMLSMLSTIRSAANQIVAQANRAIEAKARIGSPSKITTQYGEWYGEGWINGIGNTVRDAYNAAKELVSFPDVSTPSLAFDGGLSTDYDYLSNAEYVIEVPLTVDGKEFAKATATYTEDELNKRQTRTDRKHGRI